MQQRRDFELIAEIERRRRLVEQQHVGRLRQRAGDDDALLLAAAERHVRRDRRDGPCRSPSSASRAIARSLGPSSWNAPRCGWRPISTISSTRVVEGRMRFLRHDGDVPRERRAAAASASARPSSATVPLVGLQHAGQQLEQRRLAAAVRAEQAGQRAACDATLTSRSANAPVRRRCAGRTCRKRDRRRETSISSRRPSRRRPSRRSTGTDAGCEVSWLAELSAIRSVFPRQAVSDVTQ